MSNLMDNDTKNGLEVVEYVPRKAKVLSIIRTVRK